MNPEDYLYLECPNCGGEHAICLEAGYYFWTFECVACGETFQLQARELPEERAERLAQENETEED